MDNQEIPFSKAPFWKNQKEQFINLGMRSWTEKGVPLFPSSNPFFAKQAAQIVKAFADDIQDELLLLELGGGTGRFAYLLIKEIKKIYKKPFTYILTDISPMVLSFWNAHPQFAPLIEEGTLKVSLFDINKDKSLNILPKKPFFAIASYFFDSLPQELVKIEKGKTFQELFHPKKKLIPIENPLINTSKDGYKFLPISLFETLDILSSLSNNQFALLTSDFGSYPSKVMDRLKFSLKGSLAFPTDFDILDKYINARKGISLLPQYPEETFISHLSLFGQNYSHTTKAYHQTFNPKNPGTYSKEINELKPSSLPEALQVIEESNYDPCLISLFATYLSTELPQSPQTIQKTFADAFEQIHSQFFITCSQESFSITTLGLLLLSMKFYNEAILFFKRALNVFAQNVVAYYHLALTYKEKGDEQSAYEALLPLKAIQEPIYNEVLTMLNQAK